MDQVENESIKESDITTTCLIFQIKDFLRRLFDCALSFRKEHALLAWDDNLVHWFSPFLNLLDNKKQQQMCPLYYAGLIDPDARKSMELIAARGMAFCNWRERG